MRAIHIISEISEEAAGPSYSVPRLCEALIKSNVEITLASLDSVKSIGSLPYLNVFPVVGWPPKLGISPSLRKWLYSETHNGRADIIHNHSLWKMPNVYPGGAVRGTRTKFVVSPRGTMSQWALNSNKLQKEIFWRFVQGPALGMVACFCATAVAEYEDIRRLGFKQPVCILPNGVDVPPISDPIAFVRRNVLYLGRLHPIKGIDNLLRAWQPIEKEFPEWDLKIVGPDGFGYLAILHELCRQLNLKNVQFSGSLYGDEKLKAYREASLFVSPSHSENFGLTVAEAMASGTPVIVTKGAPWPDLEMHGAGWWIDIGVEPLSVCLRKALSLSDSERFAMGQAGRNWMIRDYSWRRIGQEMAKVYGWLVEGGMPPVCVKEF